MVASVMVASVASRGGFELLSSVSNSRQEQSHICNIDISVYWGYTLCEEGSQYCMQIWLANTVLVTGGPGSESSSKTRFETWPKACTPFIKEAGDIQPLQEGNMEFGLSMGLYVGESFQELQGTDLGEACLRIIDAFVEFALENGFRIIEIGSASVIAADQLFPIAEEIKKKTSKFQVVTYHLPSGEVNIAARHPGIRREAVEETKRHILLCQQIGIDKVVMHPGCFAAMPNIFLLMASHTREAAKQSILEIFEYCRAKNIELSIENLPRNEPFFQRPEEFEPFIEQGIGMVLDSVHALTSNVEPLDFITKFGNGITEVHLTDGFRKDPVAHYPIGTGEVNCLAVLNKLEEINYKGRIILEVDSKKDLLESLQYLKNWWPSSATIES